MRQVRPIIRSGDVAFIELTKGFRATIDADDIPMVSGRNWSALTSKRRNAVYACRVEIIDRKQTMILLHRLLLSLSGDVQADHRDGDGLNNRRDNLRICTHGTNQLNKAARKDNRSGLKGVSWEKRAGRWKSEISINGRKRWLGYFDSPEAAHDAYCAAASYLHGDFARLA